MKFSYRGRFAPSPTGPMHLGSLLAAAGSYLQARSQGGQWLLRIEDVDRHRCRPQWRDRLLHDLERLGLHWDAPPWQQSERDEAYHAALERLREVTYVCRCSRKTWQAAARRGPWGLIYPGTCRDQGHRDGPGRALRLRVPATTWRCYDPIQGELRQNLAQDVGDFVLRRADGLFAYQLAVVVDDAAQGITEVVRGADLWDNTPRQHYLAHCLGLTPPPTLHLPVLVDPSGRKLSKSTGAGALDLTRPVSEITRVLRLLGQEPPREVEESDEVENVWRWAIQHWDPARIPRRATLSPQDRLNNP